MHCTCSVWSNTHTASAVLFVCLQAKLAHEQRRCSELTAELAEVEGRLAGLNGQLSVTQAEGAEYVSKYSAAKSEVAGLSRQLEEVRCGSGVWCSSADIDAVRAARVWLGVLSCCVLPAQVKASVDVVSWAEPAAQRDAGRGRRVRGQLQRSQVGSGWAVTAARRGAFWQLCVVFMHVP
jgi:hypothetical protein